MAMPSDCSDALAGMWILTVITTVIGFVIGWFMCKSEMLQKQIDNSKGEGNAKP
jgi:hypothetical protein